MNRKISGGLALAGILLGQLLIAGVGQATAAPPVITKTALQGEAVIASLGNEVLLQSRPSSIDQGETIAHVL